MVQGQNFTKNTIDAISRENKRAGFESLQKKQQEQKQASLATKQETKKTTGTSTAAGNKYGAWGPVFQNREHFNSMHFC